MHWIQMMAIRNLIFETIQFLGNLNKAHGELLFRLAAIESDLESEPIGMAAELDEILLELAEHIPADSIPFDFLNEFKRRLDFIRGQQ